MSPFDIPVVRSKIPKTYPVFAASVSRSQSFLSFMKPAKTDVDDKAIRSAASLNTQTPFPFPVIDLNITELFSLTALAIECISYSETLGL